MKVTLKNIDGVFEMLPSIREPFKKISIRIPWAKSEMWVDYYRSKVKEYIKEDTD